ncbi:asparaginase [Streptoalloteichus tenebrarius]|uniref:Asparaginase n=1 Tax=Streptoalloteichus tenebrarius (strain ATCC 17920 / DSM 40477 / JCM 4838 / CBS 697.72 / NBRC 16177 / NCIMB 11028 / NRRL B-12390 / A12253. 1 / ISP 5477) TaxID=1933 RepID=A0ABT1HV48_STRSD|nr:asparaginase [Streptoalloteichus tenebrarius]MCP2259371.1 asparaginase [Streptoalloteichus tenebrarius]BFF02312.1 asparaginase [Streptoalloteichus tenebrarius]
MELVEIVRNGFREGVHRGSVVVLGPDGEVLHALGGPERPVFPRSSNKPLQGLAMLRCGLDLPDDADLALGCASHSGEPEHVERALAVLRKHGLDEDALGCPPDLPGHEASRTALLAAGGGPRRAAMNCSGKHAAMLATCVQRGWSTEDYLDPAHPLQVTVRETVEELAGERVAATAVDGCGAPLFAISLIGLARAFATLVAAEPGSPERRIADAMRAHPYLVAGTGREDTRLMGAVPGLLSKAGAEGVHAAAAPGVGAIALKITDGAGRARLPVTVGALRALGVPASAELDDLAEEDVLGGGRPVGSARLLPGVFG